MLITLNRRYNPQATCGEIIVADKTFYTVELPWVNNVAGKSCVPAGIFTLERYVSPVHGRTFCLRNNALLIFGADVLTPAQLAAGGRNCCEIHSANWARQLLGCIALGEDDQPMLDPLTGMVEPAVEGSRDAVAMWLQMVGWVDGHILEITPDPPTD